MYKIINYITFSMFYRHVKIHALNDSKNIAYCVYIVVLTSVLAVSLANLVSERVTLSFVSVTVLILTSTTSTICLLFIPKVSSLNVKNDSINFILLVYFVGWLSDQNQRWVFYYFSRIHVIKCITKYHLNDCMYSYRIFADT